MIGGVLPAALLCAALGIALSFAPRRQLPMCLALAVAISAAVSQIDVAAAHQEAIYLICWAGVILAAAAVHLPKRLSGVWAVPLSINTGVWTGAVIAASGVTTDLIQSLPLMFLSVPGNWLVQQKRTIVPKVLASWLTAVAILGVMLPLTTRTPGYVADHME